MKKIFLSFYLINVLFAESIDNAVTTNTIDNVNNAKSEDLDYLLKDSNTKFPVSDFIWQKEKSNQNLGEYFNKDKDKYPKLAGYDSNGNPIYVNEQGQVVDANGKLILKNGKPISADELKELTLKEKIEKEKQRIKQEQERLEKEKLKQQNAKANNTKSNNKKASNTNAAKKPITQDNASNNIVIPKLTEDDIEKKLAQDYLEETMNSEYGIQIDKENLSDEQRFIFALIESQRTKIKQKSYSKNTYGDSSFSNQENVDEATNEHKLYRTILAGKMIPAILLTPINSQIEGIVTAQVAENIYASMGEAVLIPRGTKIIGFYKNDNEIGQNRLAIAWREMVTPQGVNILLTNAIAGDSEGYAGVKGHLNNKYWQRYGMGIAMQTLANAGTLAIGNLTQKENANAGASYYTGQLLAQSQQDVNQTLRQIIQNQQKIRPEINIKAGSRIYIMPSAHIWFPIPKNNEIMVRYFDSQN